MTCGRITLSRRPRRRRLGPCKEEGRATSRQGLQMQYCPYSTTSMTMRWPVCRPAFAPYLSLANYQGSDCWVFTSHSPASSKPLPPSLPPNRQGSGAGTVRCAAPTCTYSYSALYSLQVPSRCCGVVDDEMPRCPDAQQG